MICLKRSRFRPLVNPMIMTQTCFASYLHLRVGNLGSEYVYWLLEGNECFTAGRFPSNPILFRSVPNNDHGKTSGRNLKG